ncbi:hypothetical protein [Ohtaekwangia koreensis]|uniref:TonB-dependent receptor plug domain-containing protein n=1 Tax=Ohtaekwangia koreensis TaxID=688867 RepID=A0A1T5LCC2_9BACT|nr:hypothetical protein [Ohtaekwangia koreensis]SKC73621.1 hypothetical protein SAMN05660236_2956 [Ohtaekwangia koreensis]
MKSLVTILLLLLSGNVYSQSNNSDTLIITLDENKQWLTKFEGKDLKDKLTIIRNRILSDTAIYIRQTFADRIRVEDQYTHEKRIEGTCKPLFILGNQPIYITNQTSNKQIENLVELINVHNIKDVRILNDSTAPAIYGSKAICGVIILDPKIKNAGKINPLPWD